MIRETYISAKKRVIPQGDVVVDLSRCRERKGEVSSLAPSRELQNNWNQGRIAWKDYVERYYQELRENNDANSLIEEIADLAAQGDVWLVGIAREYPCHRFLVKQIVERILVARGMLGKPEDYSACYELCKNLTRQKIKALREPTRPP